MGTWIDDVDDGPENRHEQRQVERSVAEQRSAARREDGHVVAEAHVARDRRASRRRATSARPRRAGARRARRRPRTRARRTDMPEATRGPPRCARYEPCATRRRAEAHRARRAQERVTSEEAEASPHRRISCGSRRALRGGLRREGLCGWHRPRGPTPIACAPRSGWRWQSAPRRGRSRASRRSRRRIRRRIVPRDDLVAGLGEHDGSVTRADEAEEVDRDGVVRAVWRRHRGLDREHRAHRRRLDGGERHHPVMDGVAELRAEPRSANHCGCVPGGEELGDERSARLVGDHVIARQLLQELERFGPQRRCRTRTRRQSRGCGRRTRREWLRGSRRCPPRTRAGRPRVGASGARALRACSEPRARGRCSCRAPHTSSRAARRSAPLRWMTLRGSPNRRRRRRGRRSEAW